MNRQVGGIVKQFGWEDLWFDILAERERKTVLEVHQPMGLTVSSDGFHGSTTESFLTSGGGLHDANPLSSITALIGWFYKPGHKLIREKLFDYSEKIRAVYKPESASDIWRYHLALGSLAEHHYRDRQDPKHMALCIELAEDQVSMHEIAMQAYEIDCKQEHLKAQQRIIENLKFCQEQGDMSGVEYWSKEIDKLGEEPDIPVPGHAGFKRLAIVYDKQGDTGKALEVSKMALSGGWYGDWEKRIARLQKKLAKQKK